MFRTGGLSIALLMAAACSGSNDDPVIEYPPLAGDPGGDPADGGTRPPGAGPSDAGPDAPEPIVGKKLLASPVFLEGRTSDGHLVLSESSDLKVWPDGASSPVTLQKDFDTGYDSQMIRGRFVAMWLGDGVAMPPLTYWSKASGLVTITGETYRDALYPKVASDELAYLVRGSTSLRQTVKVTKAAGGAGVVVAQNLALGYPFEECQLTIRFVGNELLVAGCPNSGTTPSVRIHAVDGTASRTILDDSRPGVWTNNAQTKVLVQTASTSSIRPISGAGTLTLDGRIVSAAFSSDDTKVVYLTATGKVKRASTTAPAAPVELAPAAKAILDVSPDGRFVVIATKGDVSRGETDLVVLDANAPATPRILAPERAVDFGLSSDGTKLVYIAPRELSLSGPLFVVSLPSGAPQKISDDAERVVFSGDVVYFQELDKATKTNALKAVRVATPQTVQTIEQGLDALTSRAMVVGKKLFVGSKLGLWEYPALQP